MMINTSLCKYFW